VVGWKGKTDFAGNRLHGAMALRRKVGGRLFGGEKGEALGPLPFEIATEGVRQRPPRLDAAAGALCANVRALRYA